MEITPKKFSFEDINTRVKWVNNPRIHSTMYFDVPVTIEGTQKWYERIKLDETRVDFSFAGEAGELLAMGGFTDISEKHKNSEFYIMVNPEMHGKGIGTRACEWMFNYGFSVLRLHKIFLFTNDTNSAAYKIYENAGFTLEGVLRQHRWKNGAFQNRRFYGLLASEWKRLPWKENVSDVL